jgi:CRP/FNR family cyclic AMP-dependent transcriptional regulator
MISRFEGTDGTRRLVEVLLNCQLVAHDEALAEKLASVGDLVKFNAGDVLMSQGGDDNDIYFLLYGEVDVAINGRHVAIRKTGDAVGEMAIVTPSEPRSATLTAIRDVVALKVTEPDFNRLADQHGHVWKAVAVVASNRLRQRSSFLDSPNENPLLFVGCSVESVKIAEEIQLKLKHDDINVLVWTDGVFGPSGITIEDLQDVVNKSDFAAFLFGPDDVVISRDKELEAPRDNIVFELGLFMGRLDRKRTFIIKEHHTEIKMPTDLLGINPITYVLKKSGDLTTAVAPVCTELRKAIKMLGTR